MLAIVDKRAPKEIISSLEKDFNLFLFSSDNSTYSEVSGHPDIFIFQGQDKLIIAPNTPQDLVSYLNENKIDFTFGEAEVKPDLKGSTKYNAIESQKYFFHKEGFSDSKIIETVNTKEFVMLPQAYTRCSLSMIDENSFITADKGISKVLKKYNFDVLDIDDKEIILSGFKNGFFGGCTGIFKNKFYISGSLKFHKDGDLIREFITNKGYEIIELYEGPLIDLGAIFFI